MVNATSYTEVFLSECVSLGARPKMPSVSVPYPECIVFWAQSPPKVVLVNV